MCLELLPVGLSQEPYLSLPRSLIVFFFLQLSCALCPYRLLLPTYPPTNPPIWSAPAASSSPELAPRFQHLPLVLVAPSSALDNHDQRESCMPAARVSLLSTTVP
jgi:hypothetical protein